MKVKFTISCIALNMKENKGKDDRSFYQISIDQDGEAGTLPLSADVFEANKSIFKKYTPATLTCEYNDQYKTVRVIGLNQGR